MPVSGSHNIPTLGGSPIEAVKTLKSLVDGPAWQRSGMAAGMRSSARR
jgi:hypothetical protein